MVENRGLSLFLNWLPLFLAMLLFYFAGTGAATATTIVGAVAIGLGVANRYKIILRGDPLVPWDLLLGGEVIGIARSFETRFIVLGVVLAVLYILAAVVAALVIRSEKIDYRIRIGGAIGCIVLALLLNAPLYNNLRITNWLRIQGNIWNQVSQFNSRGFMFSFINAFNTNRVMRPEGYNPAAVRQAIEEADTGGIARLEGETHPHIIMIMGEAFSDLSLSPHFNFDGFTDPLENWQELRNDAIHGEIVVSVLGGGTAQTEFDVLTGLNSRHFAGVPFAFRMINSEFESMASILNSIGYRSEFMHPGHDWFYNRQNVYRHLGFERLVFIDEFDDIPTKGMYINEHDTINRIIDMFAEHRGNHPGKPYFHFAVTIQNHGPYVDKYLLDGPVDGPNFTTDLDLQDADINALSNFFHGLQDADMELGRLADYVNALAEPVILVYFGDHLPAFNRRIYDAIFPYVYDHGSFADLTRLHRVPFMIWFNYAARELYGVQHPGELSDDDNHLFSASFLGAYVLEILGITNISPFWDFNTELRRIFPVITDNRSFGTDFLPCDGRSYEELAPLRLYRDWSYFRIFDERQ